MIAKRIAVYAAAGGFAIAALLVATGLSERMSNDQFWTVIGIAIALGGTWVVATPKDKAK